MPDNVSNKEYKAGMDCICSAYGQCECGCGADWTDPKVYELQRVVDGQKRVMLQLSGALAAQDRREKDAGIKCGLPYEEYGCDWPDAAAEEILKLRDELSEARDQLNEKG